MRSVWKGFFKGPLGFDNLKPAGGQERFGLEYKTLEIGKLTLHNRKWRFEYSNDFKRQDEIKPLVDFPDKNRVYESDELWPFFLSRIPGLNQPAVQKVLQVEQINHKDEAALLKRFGKTTITSPFTLVPEMA